MLRKLILDTLHEIRLKLNINAYLDDVISSRYHPWMITYVRFDDGYIGCGISSSVFKGMFAFPREELVSRLFSYIEPGRDAYQVVEEITKAGVGEINEQILFNALAISTLNALAHRLLDSKVFREEGLYIRKHKIGGYLFGNKIGVILQHIINPNDIVTAVGYVYWAFPFIINKVRRFKCLELIDQSFFNVYTLSGLKPRVHIYNDPKKALTNSDIVLITGMSIPNETLTDIIELSSSARLRIMYGPSSLSYPKYLFNLGIDAVLILKVSSNRETKLRIIDSRGLYPYEDPFTQLIEIWKERPQRLRQK